MNTYEQHALRRLRGKLEDSQVFLALMTPAYLDDAEALLQLGLAVAPDKPIWLLVPTGTALPENARRLARGIEEYASSEDMELAAKRLLGRIADEERR
jgi:hypothetical protein